MDVRQPARSPWPNAPRAACALVGWLVFSWLSACAAPLRIAAPFCAPPQPSAAVQLAAGEALAVGSSRQAQLAALIGVSEALAERERGPLSPPARTRVLERMALVRLAIDAVVAELDCECERTQQAADYLARKQAGIVQGMTVGSIVTAAAVGVVSVLLSTSSARPALQNSVGIGGAAATAGLGFATLYISPSLHFEHTRNLLRDIWEGPASSQVYPPVVWAYLSRATFSNAQDAPIRSKVVARFRRLRTTDDDASTLRLLFGAGGKFDADTLRAQAALLDQVKAEVALQNQDLSVLAHWLLQN
jgi:hypothetical protein